MPVSLHLNPQVALGHTLAAVLNLHRQAVLAGWKLRLFEGESVLGHGDHSCDPLGDVDFKRAVHQLEGDRIRAFNFRIPSQS